MHMISLKMENNLHKNCPKNCRDMLQWLPENVVYQILDQLDPGLILKMFLFNYFIMRIIFYYSHLDDY